MTGVIATLVWFAAVAAAQTPPSPRAWAPEVADAARAYQAGDYDTARRLCARRLSAGDVGPWRQDAALLEALCLLRMPARADRLAGRTLLRQLILSEPDLQDDPECHLAYGIAQAALAETADALESLQRSAAGFAARGEAAREAEALVALAETWARHAEWEFTPPRFQVPRPPNAATAHAVRSERIEALRERLTTLPRHEEPLARLELVFARHLLSAADTAAAGEAVLARLAASLAAPRGARAVPLAAETFAEAAWLLAQRREDAGQWDEALRLYDHLAREGPAEWAEQATERRDDIWRPQVVLECSTVSTQRDTQGLVAADRRDADAPLTLRVRGLEAVDVEIRHVDVDAWLGSSRTRVSEAFLPISGAVLLARELETRAATPYAWWISDALAPPLTLPPTTRPGAYVVLVRAADGRELVRRLLLVSDLEAACLAGSHHIVVWAAGVDGAAHATTQFWMNRSFAPTEVELTDGVARFPWPGEAVALRDKGWVCLIRCGDHLAVCRGELPVPGSAADSDVPALPMVMVSGPPAPAPGQPVHVAGLLLTGAGTNGTSLGTLELSAVDVLERVALATPVPLEAGGVFTASVAMPPSAAGEHLRFLARWQGVVPVNLAGRPTASIPRETWPDLRIRFKLPAELPEPTALLTGSFRAAYPWGTTLTGARVVCDFLPLQLPTTASNEQLIGGVRAGRGGQLDEAGRFHFQVPVSEFGLDQWPLAVRVVARVYSPEGRESVGYTDLLVGARAPHVWLTHAPSSPQVGQPVHWALGWFEPAGLTVARPPAVVVTRDDMSGPTSGPVSRVEVAHIPLRPTMGGFSGGPWLPTEPGRYLATATLNVLGRPDRPVSQTIDVSPATSLVAGDDALACAAHFNVDGPRTTVVVNLQGHSTRPVLVVLAGDVRSENVAAPSPLGADLLAAHSIATLAGHQTVRFEVPHPPQAGWYVLAGRADRDSVTWLCRQPVAPDPAGPIHLALTTSAREIRPGQTVTVETTVWREGPGRPPVALLARLINATGTGFIDPAVVGAEGAAHEEPWATCLEGVTLWCAGRSLADAEAVWHVPIPDHPGVYKLIVLARDETGAWATDTMLLDARRGVRAAVSVPPRLVLGDRAVVAMEIENGHPEAVEITLRCDGGGGLHLESLRGVPGMSPTPSAGRPSPVTVMLPAGESVWLYADVEAARVGPGRVMIEIVARGAPQSAGADYEVLPAPPSPSTDVPIQVRRRLAVWTEMRSESPTASALSLDHPSDCGVDRRLDWVAWSPTDRLLPGQLVKVEDEIVVTRVPADGEVFWSQRVPSACHAVSGPSRFGRFPGPATDGPPDEIGVSLGRLQPGRYTQEYLLSVVRPGVCLLPPPVLRRDGSILPVAVAPAEIRLRVVHVD